MTAVAYLAVLPVLVKNAWKKEMYEEYLTETVRVICENTANLSRGSYVKARYADIVDPKPEPKETRTGEEVIEHMKKRIRGG